jgi:hypothetical protein
MRRRGRHSGAWMPGQPAASNGHDGRNPPFQSDWPHGTEGPIDVPSVDADHRRGIPVPAKPVQVVQYPAPMRPRGSATRRIASWRGRALGTRARGSNRGGVALVILVASTVSSGCIDFAKGAQRAKYNYEAARNICHATRRDRQVCIDTVDEAFAEAADPATYVPKHERERLERERHEQQERTERVLARCSSAPALIRAAFAKRECTQAYKIAEESEGVCPDGNGISASLLTQVRAMSPQEVVACRSDDIARLYWKPVEIWDWFAAASSGKLIADRGVYVSGQVTQQFDDKAVVDVSEGMRVVVRFDRQRLFQIGQPIDFIGRFSEVGHFTSALGARMDMPIFDLVYW